MFLETHSLPKTVKILLISNIAIHVLLLITGLSNNFAHIFGFVPIMITKGFQIWRFITYMFIHYNIFPHLLFNMFALWMFGPEVERRMGTGQFIFYYMLCGVGGALLELIFNSNGQIPTVGSSGAIFGLFVAFAVLFPDAKIGLLFPPVTLKAKHFVIGFAIIQFLMLYEGSSGIAWIIHLGGAITGYLYFLILYPARAKPKWIKAYFNKLKEQHKEQEKRNLWKIEQKIDPILEKISKKGIDSLTRKEKQILEIYRKLKQKG